MTTHRNSFSGPVASGILALVLAVYPALQAAILGGTAVITTFFAADAFYYLAIARNSTFGRYSFDGISLTNGFHPLWQILLQLIVAHLGSKSGAEPMIASFLLSSLGVGLGIALVAAGLAKITKLIWPTLLLFPGLYFLVASQIDLGFGSIWSFINGMESPLSILFFGLFFLALVHQETPFNIYSLVLFALLSLGLILSRLDDVFLPISLGIWLMGGLRRTLVWPATIRRMVVFVSPLVAGLTLYLVFNLRTVGVIMPTSGAVKSDHLAFIKNLIWLAVVCIPAMASVLHKLSSQVPQHVPGLALSWRIVQMLIPMLVAGVLLYTKRAMEWIGREYTSKLRMLLWYVLVKGSYNLLFVPVMRQGHWYYPISIIIIDLIGVVAIARAFAEPRFPIVVQRSYVVASLCGFVLISMSGLVWRSLDLSFQNRPNIQTLARADLIKHELQSRVGSIRMIEFDDGILNYALSTPTMSGFGLAADAKTTKALTSGQLLSYASASGLNLIGTVNYSPIEPGELLTSDQLRQRLREWDFLKRERDLNDFEYTVVYTDPPTHAAFIGFVHR